MSNLSDEEIELHAQNFRQRLGYEPGQKISSTDALNRAVDCGLIAGWQVVDDESLSGAVAIFQEEDRTILLSDSEEKIGTISRQTFTIAHELAHAHLGHSGTRARLADPGLQRHSSSANIESEANRLAAAVMAPLTESFVPETSAAELSRNTGLSLQAAFHRLNVMRRLHRRALGASREIPSLVRDHLQELDKSIAAARSSKKQKAVKECENCGSPHTLTRGLSTSCMACGHDSGDDYGVYINEVVRTYVKR